MLTGLKGSITIAQTPFDDRGAVDLDSVDTLTEFYVRHGVDGFVVLGVSGEGPRLAPDEALQVASRFIARANGRPVIVGVSNPSSAQLRDMAKQAMDRGAAGEVEHPVEELLVVEGARGRVVPLADAPGAGVPQRDLHYSRSIVRGTRLSGRCSTAHLAGRPLMVAAGRCRRVRPT